MVQNSELHTNDERSNLLKKIGRFKFLEAVRNKEWKMLAEELQIDPINDPPIFSNFLNLVTNAKVPIGWKRELYPDGSLFYQETGKGVSHSVHPEINRIKRLHNDFLFDLTNQKETAILPRYKLEKMFGAMTKSPNMIYANFFEGDVEKDMHELISVLNSQTQTKSEYEREFECDELLKQAAEFYIKQFGLDHKALRDVFDKLKPYQV